MSSSNILSSWGRLESQEGTFGIRGMEQMESSTALRQSSKGASTSFANAAATAGADEGGQGTRGPTMALSHHPESVDFAEPVSLSYKEHLAQRRNEPRVAVWFFVLGTGVLTSLLTILLVSTIHKVLNLKYYLLRMGLTDFDDKKDMMLGTATRDYMMGWVMWVTVSAIFAISASLVELLSPKTEKGLTGSADVTALLNGVHPPAVFSFTSFVVKFFSTIFSMGSGLPLGYFGSIVLGGSQLGAALLGKKRTWRIPFAKYFRNPRDIRIFTTVGAAVGVTGAFAVPLGGLLFVMEMLSSAVPSRLAFYVFTSCLTTSFLIQVFFSYFGSFSLRERAGLAIGELLPGATVLFDSRLGGGTGAPMNFFTFLPAIIIGFLGGFLGALYIRLGSLVVRFRRRYLRMDLVRTLETSLVTIVYTSLTYWIAVSAFGTDAIDPTQYYSGGCHPVPSQFLIAEGSTTVGFYGLQGDICKSNMSASVRRDTGMFHPFASLSFGISDNAAQMLLSWGTPKDLGLVTLSTFFVLYFLFGALTTGARIGGDALLPSVVMGGAFGRVIGLCARYIAIAAASGSESQVNWADPGVFALIGAGAMIAGTTRLTFTTVVLLVEITNDFRHATSLMIAVSIAKAVGDKFSKSLAAAQLEANEIPVLDFYDKIGKYDIFTAKEVMATDVTFLGTVETIAKITVVLRKTTHNGFPVVSVDGTVKGLVMRSQLRLLLWRVFLKKDLSDPTYEELRDLEEQLHDTGVLKGELPELGAEWTTVRLNLNFLVDTSCPMIQERTALSRMYGQFQTIGVRHMIVTDDKNKLVGIITRKDLLTSYILRRLLDANKARLKKGKSPAQEGERAGETRRSGGGYEPPSAPAEKKDSAKAVPIRVLGTNTEKDNELEAGSSKFFTSPVPVSTTRKTDWKVDRSALCGSPVSGGLLRSGSQVHDRRSESAFENDEEDEDEAPHSPIEDARGRRKPMLLQTRKASVMGGGPAAEEETRASAFDEHNNTVPTATAINRINSETPESPEQEGNEENHTKEQ